MADQLVPASCVKYRRGLVPEVTVSHPFFWSTNVIPVFHPCHGMSVPLPLLGSVLEATDQCAPPSTVLYSAPDSSPSWAQATNSQPRLASTNLSCAEPVLLSWY